VIAFVSRLPSLNTGASASMTGTGRAEIAPHRDELFISGSEVRSVIPALGPPFHAAVHTVFDAGLVAISRSVAGGQHGASASGCKHEYEPSCDPVSGDGGE
jgi:hypothetical protein